ncbi:hypothetical protein C3L50_13225 [Flavobacterium alvei]|uniref:Uncharacterized protein n=1 Tax=Flavobacterium alvei TaxID=2080416 RepID=A0A2S5A6L5_9FLAO|nr:ankyrin repeat domain-containing protein [Flavobacterium alvei]POY38218.1 hypothetical protein C3L50_13225 [Flavobacterium alvei]
MKKVIPLIIAIGLVIFAFLYYSKMQKEKWAKESPETKYSEQRENEVWGKILRGHNAGLFYGTPLYEVADAMSGLPYFRNEKKIAKLIDEIPKEYVNYQEGKFGTTIGHFALITYNFVAIRKLLDKGLDPNLMDKNGNAIIIDINSSAYSYKSPESLKTLKYMIQKGANVNLYSKNASLSTPLIEAANSNLENVKVLVEAGANPHFIDESLAKPFQSPLGAALVNRRMEVINYLIFDQKVDFRTLKHPMDSKFHPGEYEILYDLRELRFDLNTKDYKEKMKLVAYLKTQGLDYWKTPIPERYKSNPNYTSDYLSKY